MSHPSSEQQLQSSLRSAERKLHEARRVQTDHEAMLKEAKKAVRKCEEKVCHVFDFLRCWHRRARAVEALVRTEKLTGLVQVIEKKIELETFRAKEASQAVMEELWREGYEVEDLYHKGYKRGKEDGAWTARCPGCGDEAEVVEKRDRGVGRGTGRGAWVRDGRGFVRH